MDCIQEEWDSKISKAELRRAYAEYCRKHKLPGVSDKIIKDVLARNYGVSDGKYQGEGKQIPYWQGISYIISKGSKDSNGFSTYRQISNSAIRSKTIASLTTLTYPTYVPCSNCGQKEVPCTFLDSRTQKPICESCANPKKELPFTIEEEEIEL